MSSETEAAQQRFNDYCIRVEPWRSPYLNAIEDHYALMSALKDYLSGSPESPTRDAIISLKNRLRDSAEFYNQAIKEHVEELVTIADDLVLSRSA